MEPLGRDKLGNLYWYQVDGDASMRVYKDDPEEETWELVAQNRDELVSVLNQLKSGPTVVREDAEKSPSETMEDDEDSMQDYANIIRDTGPVPESNTTSVSCSDDESSITTGERSKFKISAASSKATSREGTPALQSVSKTTSRDTPHLQIKILLAPEIMSPNPKL